MAERLAAPPARAPRASGARCTVRCPAKAMPAFPAASHSRSRAGRDFCHPCQEMSFSSGEVFTQWLPLWPHPARHTRAGPGGSRCCLHPWQRARDGYCKRRRASFLLLLLCHPNAGKMGSGSWRGHGRLGDRLATAVGLSGYIPVPRRRSDPSPVIQRGSRVLLINRGWRHGELVEGDGGGRRAEQRDPIHPPRCLAEDSGGLGMLGCRAGEFSGAAGGNGTWDRGKTREISTIKCLPQLGRRCFCVRGNL